MLSPPMVRVHVDHVRTSCRPRNQSYMMNQLEQMIEGTRFKLVRFENDRAPYR